MFTAKEAKEAVELYEQKKKNAIMEQALNVLERDIVPRIIASANGGLKSVSLRNEMHLFRTKAIEDVAIQQLKESGYEVKRSANFIRIFWMK